MGTISLADLGKSKKLHQGLPNQEERVKFKQEVVLGRDGLYLSYLSDFFDIVYRTESFDTKTSKVLQGVGVPEVEPGLTIAEKIPSGMIYRMVAWYRHVEELYGTEATMQVFYDKSEGKNDFPQEMKDNYQGAIKREGKFVYVVPEQNVTGGHVTFDGDQFPSQLSKELYDWTISNYEPVLNIHSHNSMNAFWSGEDDKNELPLYTRLCLVIGRVNTDKPQFRFSWNFEGKRHHYEDIIDTFIEPMEVKTTATGLGYEVTKTMGFDESLGFLDFDKVEFDERWDDRIKARGRYGVHLNQYRTLAELDKKDLKMSPEEEQVAKDLAVNGDYEEGVMPDLETFIQSHEEGDESLQDGFYDDQRIIDEDTEEDSVYAETWKRQLNDFKGKFSEKSKDSGVVNVEDSFRKPTHNQNQKAGKQSQSVYEKFRKDQLRKEKNETETQQTSVWDDLDRKY